MLNVEIKYLNYFFYCFLYLNLKYKIYIDEYFKFFMKVRRLEFLYFKFNDLEII